MSRDLQQLGNLPAFFDDLMNFMKARGKTILRVADVKLIEVKIHGDTATATLEGMGEVSFVRIGGRWYMKE